MALAIFTAARDDLWLSNEPSRAPYGTRNLLNCIGE